VTGGASQQQQQQQQRWPGSGEVNSDHGSAATGDSGRGPSLDDDVAPAVDDGMSSPSSARTANQKRRLAPHLFEATTLKQQIRKIIPKI